MIRVEHLFVSPGHNFFGHHDQPAGEHPIIAVGQIECVAGRGIRGDRFFEYKPDYKGQITFFSMEVMEALRRELNLSGVQSQATRRNLPSRAATKCWPFASRISESGDALMITLQRLDAASARS